MELPDDKFKEVKFVEEVIKESAHAMKGTAANLHLTELPAIAAFVEAGGASDRLKYFYEEVRDARRTVTPLDLGGSRGAVAPVKSMTPEAAAATLAAAVDKRKELMTPLCVGERTDFKNLLKAFANFTAYVETVLVPKASSLSPEAQETIRMDLLPSVSIADLKAAFEGISVD